MMMLLLLFYVFWFNKDHVFIDMYHIMVHVVVYLSKRRCI